MQARRETRRITPELRATARASAAAARMTPLVRPAVQPLFAVVVQVAAARNQVAAARNKAQRLAARRELPRLAGADMAAASDCAAVRRPAAAEALLSWAASSARKPWQRRGTFVAGRP